MSIWGSIGQFGKDLVQEALGVNDFKKAGDAYKRATAVSEKIDRSGGAGSDFKNTAAALPEYTKELGLTVGNAAVGGVKAIVNFIPAKRASGFVEKLLPNMLLDPSSHLKDRVVYRGNVFSPSRVNPRGHFGYNWAVVTVDLTEVNSEELVNDPQFQYLALKGQREMIPYEELYYGFNGYGEGKYGN
jgi:hypothetical protein